MNTNLDFKNLLGILGPMLVCSLALAVNLWTDRDSEKNSYAQNALLSELAGGVSFGTARSIPAGTAPRFVVTEDFNEDSILDLAVANAAGVSVFIGNGDGSFRPPTRFPAGPGVSYAIAVGDFNGDKHMDLAVTNVNSFSVLLGNGQGEFGAPRSFQVEPVPLSITAADFNGDGYLDLAIASEQGGVSALAVLLGDGEGGFPVARQILIGRDLRAVTAGDFVGDGNPGLALARAGFTRVGGRVPQFIPGAVDLLRGDGQGRVANIWSYTESGSRLSFLSIATADLDQDGNLDLVLIDSGRGAGVFLGNGQGGFRPPSYFALGPGFVAIGDLNLDEVPDLVVTQGAGNRIAVLLGDGTGRFGSPAFFGTGGLPNSVAIGDFNSDDVPDLVTTDFDSGAISVLLNTTFE